MLNRILLVEDDVEISAMVRDYLTKEGLAVTQAFDGEEAVCRFHREAFDLILLDLMLPKLDGMQFLRMVRETSQIPVLMLSAKDGDVDKVMSLGFGADDYITKPFSMVELAARVKAALRRAERYRHLEKGQPLQLDEFQTPRSRNAPAVLTVHELQLDLDNYVAVKNGEALKLTAKEFLILKLFVTYPKKVFTKAQIYQSVWNEEYYGDENVINVHMRRLREKIEDDPSDPRYIKTIWGIGYKLGDF